MTGKRKIEPNVKNGVFTNNLNNRKLIKNLQRILADLQQCMISVSGLEDLSELSIKRIQQKRDLLLQKMRKVSMQIITYEKKATVIEKEVLTKK